jgi:hypothetical protein
MRPTRLEFANPREWLIGLAEERDGYRRLVDESQGFGRAAYRLARARCEATGAGDPRLDDLQAAATLLANCLGSGGALPIRSLLPSPRSQPPATMTQPPAALSRPPAALSRPPAALSRPPAALSRPPAALSRPPAALSQAPAALSQPPARPALSQTPVPPAPSQRRTASKARPRVTPASV